jgi:hypothetical protein
MMVAEWQQWSCHLLAFYLFGLTETLVAVPLRIAGASSGEFSGGRQLVASRNPVCGPARFRTEKIMPSRDVWRTNEPEY